MKGLNIGIAGYGIVGKKRHACIENHKNVRILGVCDRNKEVGKSLGKDIKFFKIECEFFNYCIIKFYVYYSF